MKKEFYPAIRSGLKTTTLRFWRRPMVRPGQMVSVRGLGRLGIRSVRAIRLEELSESDAKADGFDDLKDLTQTLEAIYPPQERQGRTLYQVHFAYLSETQAAAAGPPGDRTRGKTTR